MIYDFCQPIWRSEEEYAEERLCKGPGQRPVWPVGTGRENKVGGVVSRWMVTQTQKDRGLT